MPKKNYTNEARKQEMADQMQDAIVESKNLAEKFGLEPYDLDFHIVDSEEMNEYAAYGGYPERYPHWRWGMMYDIQKKKGKYLGGRLYELVINNDPADAYLQESNRPGNQKLTITHVQAHSDFFANNEAFQRFSDDAKSVDLLAENGRKIREYMDNPDIDRDEVEKLIDDLLTLENNINQHVQFKNNPYDDYEEEDEEIGIREKIEQIDELRDAVDEEWIKEQEEKEKEKASKTFPSEPEEDLMFFLREYGKRYDDEEGKAVDREDWEEHVIDMIRDESYFFGPQKMTKVMNEGWSAYWHAMMMEEEQFADEDEIIDYAESNAGVLSGDPTNPYTLGKKLFTHIENAANRKEVASRLLQVEGIEPMNFHDEVDFSYIRDELEAEEPLNDIRYETLDELAQLEGRVDEENIELAKKVRDLLSDEDALESVEEAYRTVLEEDAEIDDVLDEYEIDDDTIYDAVTGIDDDAFEDNSTDEVKRAVQDIMDIERWPWKVLNHQGLVERHYSLNKLENKAFLEKISQDELAEIDRYLDDQYSDIDEALADVDYEAGWDKIFDVRTNHVDMTFIDEFMTQEFVDENRMYAYENLSNGEVSIPVVTSTDVDEVKKKLVFQHMNFGKPIVKVHDANYDNKNELMLGHEYHGVEMDQSKAFKTLERVHELWGRPVHLKTIMKHRDEEYKETVNAQLQWLMYKARMGEELPQLKFPEPDEVPVKLSYDGEEFKKEALEWDEVEDIAANDADYKAIPDELLL